MDGTIFQPDLPKRLVLAIFGSLVFTIGREIHQEYRFDIFVTDGTTKQQTIEQPRQRETSKREKMK